MSMDFVSAGTLTADGDAAWFKHAGGRLAVSLQDEFGGGTATLEVSFDDGTTVGTATDTLTDETISVAAGVENTPYLGTIEMPACWVRWSLSGASSPNLQWKIEKVGH